ncbi:MAG: FAD:protein FMN transferase [Gammaproteobacteria bacterium]
MSAARSLRPRSAIRIFFVGLLLLLSACSREAPLRHSQFLAFGTLVEITLYDVDEATAQRAEQAIEQDFQRWDRDWHAWRPSALTAINARLAQRQTAPVDGALRDLIVRARALSLASDNLFDPALGRLFALWGFQRDEPEGPPPAPAQVATLLAHLPTMADVHIERNSVRSDNPAVQFDFGAIAKGYAAQLAIEHLQRLGIHNAIVAAAGDLHVLGRHGARAWHIGIRDPRAPGVIAAVDLDSGESISTSGDYERYFTYQGKRYHHLLDPRSGAPAQGTRAVTVIARDGATADATATALFIAGPRDWPRIARAMSVDTVLLIDAAGTVQMSAPMAARLHFASDPAPAHVIKPLP